MDSFDLFDTLVAAPDPAIPAGDQDRHFPIAEILTRVAADDVVCSDYYDTPKAQRIVSDICGLKNRLFCSPDGKRTGEVWKQIAGLKTHTGDNQETDIRSAQRAGIQACHTAVALMTKNERFLCENGFPALAGTCREARLRLWNEPMRPFQMLQTQVNFPLLFIASLLLHRVAVNHSDVLMSARDCFLWSQLQKRIRDMNGGTYRIHYFLTSRIARARASESYLAYTEKLMGERPLMIDLCGYGRTLPSLVSRTRHPDAPVYLLAKYSDTRTSRVLSWAPGNSWIERANLAQHAMVVDVASDGCPVYSNPANIEWEHVPEIQASHEAFLFAMDTMGHYDFKAEKAAGEPTLRRALTYLLEQMSSAEYRPALTFRNDSLLLQEEQPILDELKRLESKPTIQPRAVPTPVIVTRLHCEMPYFAQLAVSDGLTFKTLNTLRTNPFAQAGSNSPKMTSDLEILLGKPCHYLPSVYPLPELRPSPGPKGIDDVACFGRVFSLKNITTQAIAAMRFSRDRKTRLRFHINDTPDHDGRAIIDGLRLLFSGQPNAELILHKWTTHADFLRLLQTMTIGLQVSLSECSNVLSLDMLATGLPIVVSPEIKWATEESVCYPTCSTTITERMHYAMAHLELITMNRSRVQDHNEHAIASWRAFFGQENPRVVFLTHNPSVNTGILTVAENDIAMLRKHGIEAEAVRCGFTPEQVRRVISEKRPTHIVSEASWKTIEILS